LNKTFQPCRLRPADCLTVQNTDGFLFHQWKFAMSFALGRTTGQKRRHRVTFDGRHWQVEDIR